MEYTAEKVIFLDVDGVLNDRNTPTRTKQGCLFVDESKILLLRKIVDATGAKIVLSSTWRYDRDDFRYNSDFLELKEAMAAHGLEFYSYTPVEPSGTRRGMEIEAWLGVHPEVKKFVILDDELFDYMERGLLERLQLTHGLKLIDVHMAIQMLDKDPFYSESNVAHLRRGVAALNAGEGQEHEIMD